VTAMVDTLMWVAVFLVALPFIAFGFMLVLVIITVVKMIIEEITGW